MQSVVVRPLRRPARKDRLAPYRLPEGARLPGKLRQDQAAAALEVLNSWPVKFFLNSYTTVLRYNLYTSCVFVCSANSWICFPFMPSCLSPFKSCCKWLQRNLRLSRPCEIFWEPSALIIPSCNSTRPFAPDLDFLPFQSQWGIHGRHGTRPRFMARLCEIIFHGKREFSRILKTG